MTPLPNAKRAIHQASQGNNRDGINHASRAADAFTLPGAAADALHGHQDGPGQARKPGKHYTAHQGGSSTRKAAQGQQDTAADAFMLQDGNQGSSPANDHKEREEKESMKECEEYPVYDDMTDDEESEEHMIDEYGRYYINGVLQPGEYEQEEQGTYRRENPKIGRNDPCPCGSGKKYKKCCGAIQ